MDGMRWRRFAVPSMPSAASRFLRVGLALCFIGHGLVAVGVNEPWLGFFTPFGIDSNAGRALMPIIGWFDFVVAVFLVVRPELSFLPARAGIIWALVWTTATALMRPATGGDVFDFLVRGSNWGPALALLVTPRFAGLAIVVALACVALGVAGGAPILPDDGGVAQWLEKAGLVALVLALVDIVGASRPRSNTVTS
jgi:hypothetical protein